MVNGHEGRLAVKQSFSPQLKALVERAGKAVGASYAFLFLCDQDSSELRCAACYGLAEAPEGLSAVAGWVLSRGEAICLQGEEDAKEATGSGLNEAALPLICVRVMGPAAPQGVLAIGLPLTAGEEPSRWLPLLQSLADLAGAHLEIEALRSELFRKEEQVRALVRDTLDAQEAERERVCLDVHDGVTQTLVSAFQYLQTLEGSSSEGTPARQLVLRASALIRQAIQESREVVNSLQPATLRDLGLVATLRQEMRQLEQETRWKVDFRADPLRLPRDIETGLYRIVHEAVTNARKHAETDRLCLTITPADDRLKIEVRDWGKGFNYSPQDMSVRRGTGLLSMRRRAELLQGTFDIESSPGHGTTVCVEIPLSQHMERHG